MQYDYIETHDALVAFCERIADAKLIAFDTEFVSEDRYRPQLCLVQVAAGGHLAVIDPLAFDDISPFWDLLNSPGKQAIVHAGREEFRFCLAATGTRPSGWFDVQVAAGFVGLEYPAAYSTLVSKLANRKLPKGETRTDWRRRPLSRRQIEYALNDVTDLEQVHDVLSKRIADLGRTEWLAEELDTRQTDLEVAERTEQWRRVSGISNLGRRQLAIVREVWRWRDEQARSRDMPPKRVLRDDLIVELARRQTADPRRIRAVRGMERRGLQSQLDDLAEHIEKALALPDDECPSSNRPKDTKPQMVLLGQFLSSALSYVCRSAELAPTIVGTVQDVRDLVAYRLKLSSGNATTPPALATGWRAEIVGQVIDDLLAGRAALRIVDPMADQPLGVERLGGDKASDA